MTDRVLGKSSRAPACPFRRSLTAGLRFALVIAVAMFVHPAAAQDAPEIQVTVSQYGVGNAARAGDWIGIQVGILDSAPEQRDIIIRLSVRDADGDRAMYDRVVTANPGLEQSFWIYARLPYQVEQSPPGITVFEAIETDAGDAGQLGYRAGRLLGRFDPSQAFGNQILPATIDLAGVVGPYPAGLDQYNITVSNRPWSPFGHELTRIATGIDIPRLPDQWQGLEPFSTLLWAESTTRATEPMALTPERANAVRTWVERGGHLIIIIPPAGDPWFATRHPLSAILPDILRPQRHEGVNLDSIRAILTESAEPPLPGTAVLHTFTPSPDATPGTAVRVLDLPDGGAIAIRRIVGAGAVTVVGLDLTAGPLRRYGLPDAEAFWHRILGRRGDIRRVEELSPQETNDAGSRRELDFDHDIASTIARTGSAVQGVLFGLVVFISYWLIAGPIGFILLRRRGLHQHAWVAFAACTAIFTALAWAGATVLRPKRVTYTHLTLLESVHGQATARARTWSSVMLPSYGQSTVSLATSEQRRSHADWDGDLLAPWEPPGNPVGWSKGFPDNSGYRVEARSPDTLTVPTRATIKQFRADSAGLSAWESITLQRDPASLDEPRIIRQGLRLTGVLTHDLPAPMTDVRVFICPGQIRIMPTGTPLAGAAISGVTVLAPQFNDRAWLPGDPLDLAAVSAAATAASQTRSFDYFRSAVREGIATGELTGAATGGGLTTRLTAVRFLSQFAPPNYRDDRDVVGNRLARRVATHGWDLGRWVTTPCVIVTGFVEVPSRDASPEGAPFPLYVNDRAAPASGMTMVTWIYPLPDETPRWFEPGADTLLETRPPGASLAPEQPRTQPNPD